LKAGSPLDTARRIHTGRWKPPALVESRRWNLRYSRSTRL